MKELEFIERWQRERSAYEKWGEFVAEEISREVELQGKVKSDFFKCMPKPRVKTEASLVEKAFYRVNKTYDSPYEDIEDKVGVRFVVLLIEDIEFLCSIIEGNESWEFDRSRHFEHEKKENPLLFTYQSVHYVVRPKNSFTKDGIAINGGVPCEIQIRTLLQHAHAELTHDAIYKSKKTVEAGVHRTVAKSMALIETTDSFFSDVVRVLNSGPVKEFKIVERLNSIYLAEVGLMPYQVKSSMSIWDSFESLVTEDLVEKISKLLNSDKAIFEVVKEKYSNSTIYQDSVILFVYWMLKKRKTQAQREWPLSNEMLQELATDFGVSLD